MSSRDFLELTGYFTDFFNNLFPFLTFISLSVVFITMAIKEKRKRAMILEISEEEKKIRAMADISDTEKEELIKALNPLPEVKEAYPLPDFHLRLVSALAKTFSSLIIVLAAVTIFCGIGLLAANQPSYGQTTVTSNFSHGPILTTTIFTILLALWILQFNASVYVTRGSNLARRYLIAMYILEMGFVRSDLFGRFSIFTNSVIFIMCIYSIWVLALRRLSLQAITFTEKSTPKWAKTAIVICLVLSLLSGFKCSLNFKQESYQSKMNSGSGSVLSGYCSLKVNKIILQAGDESTETWQCMELIQQKLNVPCTIHRFTEPALKQPLYNTAYFLVNKVEASEYICQNLRSESTEFSHKIKSKYAKQIRAVLKQKALLPTIHSSHDDLFNNKIFTKKLAFKLVSPFAYHNLNHSNKAKNTLTRTGYSKLTPSVEIVYNGKDEKAYEEVTDNLTQALNQHFQELQENRICVDIPEFLQHKKDLTILPDIPELPQAKLVVQTKTLTHDINLYRINISFSDIEKAFHDTEWKPKKLDKYDPQINKGNESIKIIGESQCEMDKQLSHLWVIHSQKRDNHASEQEMINLCQTDFTTFIALFKNSTVPEDIFAESYAKYLENKDIPAFVLINLNKILNNYKSHTPKYDNLLTRAAKTVTTEDVRNKTYFNNINSITTKYQKMEDNNPCKPEIANLLKDSLVNIKMTPNDNGIYTGTASVDYLTDRAVILHLTCKEENIPDLITPVYALKNSEKTIFFFDNSSTTSDNSVNAGYASYGCWDYMFNNHGSGGLIDFDTQELKPQCKNYLIHYKLDAENNKADFKIAYNSNYK